MVEIGELKRDESLDYLKILKALLEIPFPVGKNLLTDFLMGKYNNKSITKNNLDELHHFGTLDWERSDISQMLDTLIHKGFIDQTSAPYNEYVKVLSVTLKGQNEIAKPSMNKKRTHLDNVSEITEDDEKDFDKYQDFLEGYNPEQKKAIVSSSEKILTIAGAGSGKTMVLTKRIEFLIKERGILPEEILAITFTRKARDEMLKRLSKLDVEGVNVHTFNSFCENFLKKHEQEVYGKRMRMMSYADKILALNMALTLLGQDIDSIIEDYFTKSQKENKTKHKLQALFLNDCFSVRDYLKITNQGLDSLSKKSDENVQIIHEILKTVSEHMGIQGMRDYIDQIIDTVNFFKKYPSKIPQFKHILVDEYQDVNSKQVEILQLLNPKNLFAVGDPRQSIFGWRGSDVNFILNFEKEFEGSEIINLTKNYRSKKKLIKFMNESIRLMNFKDLESTIDGKSEINLINFESEEEEMTFVIKMLKEAENLQDFFVLARTNRQINELSKRLHILKVPHILKTDEIKSKDSEEGKLTLATIHSIKGLESKNVIVMGCNNYNFPCRASDHPVIEAVKTETYDKNEEEHRLFYVAISRAKDNLYLTYSGKNPTYFINQKMMDIINES